MMGAPPVCGAALRYPRVLSEHLSVRMMNGVYPKIDSVFDRPLIPMSSVSVNIFVQPEADTCSSGF